MTREPLEVVHLRANKQLLRIALVTETYPPDVNGVSQTLQRLTEGLHDRGHEIFIVRPRPQLLALEGGLADLHDQGDSSQVSQVMVKGLPIPMYSDLRFGLPAKGFLTRLWSSRRPDLVHIATEGPLGWSAMQAAKKLKIPTTSDFRTNFHAYSAFYKLGWLKGTIVRYLRKFHNATNRTMVPTEELRESLASQGFRRLTVVPRGIDTGLFSPVKRSELLRQSWGATDKTLVVLSVGRLAAEKNLDLAVEAFHQLRSGNSDVRLVFVGDGPLRQKLARECPEALFAGVRRGEDLAAHYASADIFLFPSLTETFGNVTLEAMASGLAVVAFDCAGAKWLIQDQRNGCTARPHDNRAFIRTADALCKDGALRQKIRLAARQTSLDSSWESIVAKAEGVMAEAALGYPAMDSA
ncbi:MAG: glycosyltransferase family 4 protein [Burkholderiaceae bacterium]